MVCVCRTCSRSAVNVLYLLSLIFWTGFAHSLLSASSNWILCKFYSCFRIFVRIFCLDLCFLFLIWCNFDKIHELYYLSAYNPDKISINGYIYCSMYVSLSLHLLEYTFLQFLGLSRLLAYLWNTEIEEN